MSWAAKSDNFNSVITKRCKTMSFSVQTIHGIQVIELWDNAKSITFKCMVLNLTRTSFTKNLIEIKSHLVFMNLNNT